MLSRVQKGLEALYRVDTRVAVDDFVIGPERRETFAPARAPREQLLVTEVDGELELGLFVDPEVLHNLARHDPADGLHGANLEDFLLAIEGVSHFVYLVWRAQADQRVSALELELQAEVDKYVTCLLVMERAGDAHHDLAATLFRDVVFADDLAGDEHRRYRVANDNARRYSESLQRRFVRRRRLAELLREVREFYRQPLAGKLDWIRAAA